MARLGKRDASDVQWQRAVGEVLSERLENVDPDDVARALTAVGRPTVLQLQVRGGRGDLDDAVLDGLCAALGVDPNLVLEVAEREYELERRFPAPPWASGTDGWEENNEGSLQRHYYRPLEISAPKNGEAETRAHWEIEAVEQCVGAERFLFPPVLTMGVVGRYRDEATLEFASAEDAHAFAAEILAAAALFGELTA